MEENDVLSFREESTFFLGRAKVQISNLDFDRVVQIHEKRHVEKLVDVFRGEGCHRLDPWNHVPAIVSPSLLSESLQAAGLQSADLMREGEPIALEFSMNLQLLHGRRRLLAAEADEYLWNKWWVVELYSDGRPCRDSSHCTNLLSAEIPTKLRISMCEQYLHSRPFCDGDIYRYILKYHREENVDEEEKWIRRLSNSKKFKLQQLRSRYQRLANGFAHLTPYSGIWYQLHLGCLNRILPDKTPEVCHPVFRLDRP
jgi:hypothetical protein